MPVNMKCELGQKRWKIEPSGEVKKRQGEMWGSSNTPSREAVP
jgi:hypothetical protein